MNNFQWATRSSSELYYLASSLEINKFPKSDIFQDPVKHIPAGNYLFKVNNRYLTTRTEICSKLTTFQKYFEYISHLVHSVSIVNFKYVNVCWDDTDISVKAGNCYFWKVHFRCFTGFWMHLSNSWISSFLQITI